MASVACGFEAFAPGEMAQGFGELSTDTADRRGWPKRHSDSLSQIEGSSAALRVVLEQARTVGPTDASVLISGETGTGKELLARAIHELSLRRQRRLVILNCAALPSTLLESELFGYERGAFTGAIGRKIGRFELADNGTLFLDEIGEMPMESQPKLLRALQEKAFERLGGVQTQQVDARLIAATNRDLGQMVADRQFRSDLYFRLNIFPIALPALRERREDIPALAYKFLKHYAGKMNKNVASIPEHTLGAMRQYHWPGNIRELQNFVERAVILSAGPSLRAPIDDLRNRAETTRTLQPVTLSEAESGHILSALRQTNWVVGGPRGAATRLGLKRTTLISKMRKLGIARAVQVSSEAGLAG